MPSSSANSIHIALLQKNTNQVIEITTAGKEDLAGTAISLPRSAIFLSPPGVIVYPETEAGFFFRLCLQQKINMFPEEKLVMNHQVVSRFLTILATVLILMGGIFILPGISPVWALDIPAAHGYVTDLTDTLDRDTLSSLNRELAAFEQSTSNQIVVVLIPSLQGNDLESFSHRLAETWQVGQEGKDNGVVLLVVKEDRKIRIEVGYGLEGAIPDALAGTIIRKIIVPSFRSGDFAGGIREAVHALMDASRGEFTAPARERGSSEIPWFFGLPFISLFMIAGGCVFGHGISYLKYKQIPVFLFVWSLAFCSIALFMAFSILNQLALVEVLVLFIAIFTGYRFMAYRGGPSGSKRHSTGWTVVSGSGSSGSGGGGGGGFSGGGGSFGGGGASGSW